MHNPLDAYRRTQREIRRQFDAFTRANCPTCPTPCCRQPARILPTDILLAEATGWRAHLPKSTSLADAKAAGEADMVMEMAGRAASALHNSPDSAEAAEGEEALPCEYLGERGCTFPNDLRPFGCTAYICKYMYEKLDRPTLTRIKRLARELEEQHDLLLRSARPVQWRNRED